MILFIDTTQNGIAKDYNAHFSMYENFPDIIRFSYLLTNNKGFIVEEGSFLINPENSISPLVKKITGISTNMLKEHACNFIKASQKIISLTEKASLIVGYNVKYDIKLLLAQLHKFDIANNIEDIHFIDLREHSNNIFSTNKQFRSLESLYFSLFEKNIPLSESVEKLKYEKKCYFKLKYYKCSKNKSIF